MNKLLTIVVTLSAFNASIAMAADKDNPNDTPVPVATPVIVPAPAKTIVPVTKPGTAAPAKPITATPTPPAATDSSTTTSTHHHHTGDGTGKHHHGDGHTAIDPNCSNLVVDGEGRLVGSPGCNTNPIASTYPSAIIQNGYMTYPPGTTYALNGVWQVCPGPLVYDTRYNTTTCEAPVIATAPDDSFEPAAPSPATRVSTGLTSDSNSSLRSDSNRIR